MSIPIHPVFSRLSITPLYNICDYSAKMPSLEDLDLKRQNYPRHILHF